MTPRVAWSFSRPSLRGLLVGVLLIPSAAPAGWQTDINGSANRAAKVAVDGGDDVISGGTLAGNGDSTADLGVVKLSGATGAELWRRVLISEPSGGFVSALAVDGMGDAIAAGALDNASTVLPPRFIVLKMAATTGNELWRYEIAALTVRGSNFAFAVALDGNGNVIAAGRTQSVPDQDDYYVTDFTVVKLDGASGTPIWRTDLAGDGYDGSNLARAVVIDANGDVLAGGVTDNFWSVNDFTVAKLAGGSGAELWRRVIDGTGVNMDPSGHDGGDSDAVSGLALDAAGDVLAVGQIAHAVTGRDLLIVKLSGLDGSELWRREVTGTVPPGTDCTPPVVPPASLLCVDYASDVDVDVSGDAYVTGGIRTTAGTEPDGIALKIAGADGAIVWQRTITGTGGGEDGLRELRLGADGNPVTVGYVHNIGSGDDILVAKLSGVDGTVLWRGEVDGGSQQTENANGVALDGNQDVLVAGSTGYTGSASNFTVLKLDGNGTPNPTKTPTVTPTATATTTPVTLPVRGTKLLLKDRAGAPEQRKLVLLAKDPGAIVPAAPGSSGDPIAGGGALEVTNPTTAETMMIALPAQGWSGRGIPPGSDGYRYSDPTFSLGPCMKVDVKAGKLKALCRGSGLTFSLDESQQGSLRVQLRTGPPSAARYCMLFGGVTADRGTVGGALGVFKAQNALPPGACP